jgi:WhiB family transcriptional regulator, redox-sensing transcriptional regulator
VTWQNAAACAGTETPAHWFPHDVVLARPALDVCDVCPVVTDCLDFALHHRVHGIWGGTTDTQRRRIRSRRGIVALPLMFQGTP